MKNINFLSFLLVFVFLTSCKDQLDVKNPNQPTLNSLNSENGLLAYCLGGIYYNGFKNTANADGVPGYFWAGAMGFHSSMGDEVGAEAANWYMNEVGCPDFVTLDNGTKVANPNSPAAQYALIRGTNQKAQSSSNPTFHEWVNMYSLNNACNTILSLVDKTSFASGNADTKKNTIKAWCYWWKGFAYARIGSIYYAGLINNDPNTASSVYFSKEAIITESNANLDKAATILAGLAGDADYQAILTSIIPNFVVAGKGGIFKPAEFIRNINTLKARNILVNTSVASMSAAQWSSIATLTAAGITATDLVFTGRTNANGDIWDPQSGTVDLKTYGTQAGAGTYKISERLMQDYKKGDLRLANNFVLDTTKASPWIGNGDRGNVFNTRWYTKDAGFGLKDKSGTPTITLINRTTPSVMEFYLAGTYEENSLMAAEAKIYTSDIEGGLKLIDAVRASQGAGLAAITGTSLTLAQAKEELRLERRSGLAFRTLAFYDARRWGVTDKAGPGRSGCVVIDKAGNLNVKATINYNYLDYWDVPDNELSLNPAASGSAPTSNPKQ